MTLPNIEQLQKAYEEINLGAFEPELIVINGADLNELEDVNIYNSSKVYHIISEGITEVEIED